MNRNPISVEDGVKKLVICVVVAFLSFALWAMGCGGSDSGDTRRYRRGPGLSRTLAP